MKNSFLKLNLV